MKMKAICSLAVVLCLGVALASKSADPAASAAVAQHGAAEAELQSNAAAVQPGDLVIAWNRVALEVMREEPSVPPIAARNAALLHVAIFDTINCMTGQNYEPYLVFRGRGDVDNATPDMIAAAINKVALDTLSKVWPAFAPKFKAAYKTFMASIRDGPKVRVATSWAADLCKALFAFRGDDNSNLNVCFARSTAPGKWQPTPQTDVQPEIFGLDALLNEWGKVRPFVISSAQEFRTVPPPALDSAHWTEVFDLTRKLGCATCTKPGARTAEQEVIAKFWADGFGTATPPGHWNVIAADIAISQGLSLIKSARLFALLNLALADSGIVAWESKYFYQFWRPITAIRNAHMDGNDDTQDDPHWRPLLNTPNHPDHPSGHSTFSGAAGVVMENLFGNIEFSTTSEDAPAAGARTFTNWEDMSNEAGLSRIYGGIHHLSAKEAGHEAGKLVGEEIIKVLKCRRPGGCDNL